MESEIRRCNPHKIDIGAVFTAKVLMYMCVCVCVCACACACVYVCLAH